MANAKPCQVPPSAWEVIPGADFADAYEAEFQGRHTALDLARNALTHGPRWMGPLMALRNAAVKPFGLVTEVARSSEKIPPIGFFPVQSVTEQRVVLGLDDKHLDFRLVADALPTATDNTQFIISTVIKRHNLLGHGYLAVVLPFHRRIVPAFLARAAP